MSDGPMIVTEHTAACFSAWTWVLDWKCTCGNPRNHRPLSFRSPQRAKRRYLRDHRRKTRDDARRGAL